jgi:nicotinamide mononucleotide transporter
MSWTEIAGFVTGAACVWLLVRQNIWNFPFGIANNLLYVWLFVRAGLYADSGLQLVYVALALVGWYWWLRGGGEQRGVTVAEPSAPVLVVCMVCVGVIAAILQWGLLRWTNSTVAGWDAITTALSLVAQFMLSRKWIANWWLWIAADVIYIPLYAYKGLWLTAALYVIFLAMCIAGVMQWRAAWHASRREALAGAG